MIKKLLVFFNKFFLKRKIEKESSLQNNEYDIIETDKIYSLFKTPIFSKEVEVSSNLLYFE